MEDWRNQGGGKKKVPVYEMGGAHKTKSGGYIQRRSQDFSLGGQGEIKKPQLKKK